MKALYNKGRYRFEGITYAYAETKCEKSLGAKQNPWNFIKQQERNKALFTRREGYPSKRVTLARTHLFLFSSSCLQGGQGYPGRRVILSACWG